MKMLRLIITLISAMMIAQSATANVRPFRIFASNMVLQQKSQCPIWGTADPGESITVTCSWGVQAQAIAGANGKWEVTVTTPSYGGPYTITYTGKNTIEHNNVLIGDVFLACGDSNMQLPLMGWDNDSIVGGYEIMQHLGENENIRFFGIRDKISFLAEDDCEAIWYQNTREFMPHCSALAFIFAKKLNDQTGVPVGMITASLRSSSAESWISEEYLARIPNYEERITQYHEGVPQQSTLTKWIKGHRQIDTDKWDNFNDDECARIGYDDSQWPSMELPTYFDNDDKMGPYDGVLWFRKWVDIPAEWQEKQLILSLGPIDDNDETYVNGEKIGRTLEAGMHNVDRNYKILPGLVRNGRLLVAVRVIDNGSGGGMPGRPGNHNLLKIHPEGDEENGISLTGAWKYMPVGEFCDMNLYAYDYKNLEFNNRPKVTVTLNEKTIASCYKAMLHPIMPFKIAAALWCHSESNMDYAEDYYRMLPQLAECWREGFQSPSMKFYYWQCTPSDFKEGTKSYELREAQRRCLDIISNSAMVCLMDLGRKDGIRSQYKIEAAERMVNLVLTKMYAKKMEVSGPLYQSMEINKSSNSIELTFSNTTGGLVVKGEGLEDFEISDNNGNYYPANATIVGDKVVVSSPEVSKPRNVRYAWKNWVNSPSLFNGAGLPASSFSTEKTISIPLPKK